MNEIVLTTLFIVLALACGIGIGHFIATIKNRAHTSVLSQQISQLQIQCEEYRGQLSRNLEQYKEELSAVKMEAAVHLQKAEDQREAIRREKDFLSTELTRKTSEVDNLQQGNLRQKAEVEKLQEKFTKEFENLANRILDQKSEKFTLINKENIKSILTPLSDKIKSFEDKVDKNSNDFIERHAQMGQYLQILNEQHRKISEEATNLTRALKGNTHKQGNWGEMILESVLERSGLEKGREYFVQQNFHDKGKNVRPDVVIHLPGDKKMIVDSKVSLVAYERCVNENDESQRTEHLKAHLVSVRKRVEELSAKDYHHLYDMESPDFVLLFIPIEPAFALASNHYPGLYQEAFDKNIIIVTPTTLLAVLKTVDSMWQNEKQKQNALDIATQAGALYDSFASLTSELLKVGRQIDTVQGSYDTAMKKLTGKGNLISRVERLKKLGAKASKQLDQKLISQAGKEDPEKKKEVMKVDQN